MMARLRYLRGTQEYKEPSSCLGPFGDSDPSVRGGGQAGGQDLGGRERGKVLSECTKDWRLE